MTRAISSDAEWIRIAALYGERQLTVVIEELSELQKALCKWIRGRDKGFTREEMSDVLGSIVEEVADVEIMLFQLRVILQLDENDIKHFQAEKLERMLTRMEQRAAGERK